MSSPVAEVVKMKKYGVKAIRQVKTDVHPRKAFVRQVCLLSPADYYFFVA